MAKYKKDLHAGGLFLKLFRFGLLGFVKEQREGYIAIGVRSGHAFLDDESVEACC